MSTSGAVQYEAANAGVLHATGTDGVPNLQQMAAERLAAHRHRRASAAAQEAEMEALTRGHREALRQARRDDQRRGASVVRDAVKARYEQRASYREFLAAEAERAIAQAQAEAEIARRNAEAVAESQMALLEELETLNRPEPGPREQAFAQVRSEARGELAHALADIALGAQELIREPVRPVAEPARRPAPFAEPSPAVREVSSAGLTVRLFEDIPATVARDTGARKLRGDLPLEEFSARPDEDAADMLCALEEEISFRRDPEFPFAGRLEATPIPGNLIEFPRELVAPRRARPRLAEGPLLEDVAPQLRIFEVDPLQEPEGRPAAGPFGSPEWQTLLLDAQVAAEPSESEPLAPADLALMPQTAPLERRLMAAVVDLCCVAVAVLATMLVAFEAAGPSIAALPLPLAALSTVTAAMIFWVGYQLLFFSFAQATPGMRYARIALCTFADGNPSRPAMRRRVVSNILAACPLGLGLLWSLLDDHQLGWNDRMSRMYQRAY